MRWKGKWKEALPVDNIPAFLGLIFRAGRLVPGEEPAANACLSRKAQLVLTAKDASENTLRRTRRVCQSENVSLLSLPLTKAEMGSGLGWATCAVAAVTDLGFAATLLDKLAAADESTYGSVRDAIREREQRARRRRDPKYAEAKRQRREARSAKPVKKNTKK